MGFGRISLWRLQRKQEQILEDDAIESLRDYVNVLYEDYLKATGQAADDSVADIPSGVGDNLEIKEDWSK